MRKFFTAILIIVSLGAVAQSKAAPKQDSAKAPEPVRMYYMILDEKQISFLFHTLSTADMKPSELKSYMQALQGQVQEAKHTEAPAQKEKQKK